MDQERLVGAPHHRDARAAARGAKKNAAPSAAIIDRGSLSGRLSRPEEFDNYHALMRQHHYLKGSRSAGDTSRYFAQIDGSPVALLTWGAAAYKLKDRNNWIGWGLGLRKTRLILVAQNRRFCLLLKRGERPNLASQILGACLRRPRADWHAQFGYEPLVAETYSR